MGQPTTQNTLHHRQHPPSEQHSTILLMDHYQKESDVLSTSHTRVDEFIQIGKSALNELYEQKSLMKGTQRRLLDVANSLGMGQSMIRLIEQRTTQDKWILYGGMGMTLFCIFLIVHFLK